MQSSFLNQCVDHYSVPTKVANGGGVALLCVASLALPKNPELRLLCKGTVPLAGVACVGFDWVHPFRCW